MTSFLSSLINRHTVMANIVKPRFATMFETESFAADDGGFSTANTESAKEQGNTSNSKYGSIAHRVNEFKEPSEHIKSNVENSQPHHKVDETASEPLKAPWASKQPKYHSKNIGIEDINKENVLHLADIKLNLKPATDNSIAEHTARLLYDNLQPSIDKPSSNDILKDDSFVDTEDMPGHGILQNDVFVPVNHMQQESPNAGEKRNYDQDNYLHTPQLVTAPIVRNLFYQEPKKAVIKVSIGQIEVKAIQEPQRSVDIKRKSTEAPRMSLDDYLKMRNANS